MAVGGPVTGDLIRSAALGGRVIINGGFSPQTFTLHNFDVLLRVIEIRAHFYRYFFTPPKPEDVPLNAAIIDAAGRTDFTVAVGGTHRLDDFATAIAETLTRPERGKRFFEMASV